MKHKTSSSLHIYIDFQHFFPAIIDYLETISCYAIRDIPLGINDIIFDWLLDKVNNFTVMPCPHSWRLYRYFCKEETFEIFDELFLSFIDFLREKGIERGKHYEVKRGRLNRCSCIMTAKVTPNFR